MNNKRIIPVLIALIFCSIPSFPQEIYDLENIIKIGLEKNFSILIARNNQEVSSNNYSLGNAGMLPSLSGSSRYGGTINNTQTSSTDTKTTGIHNTSTNAAISLDWTIFQGFQALTSYKRLNELKQVGELNTQSKVEDFIADIASEYYFYIQQLQLYKNLAYAVSLSRERVRIDQERYLLGSGSKLQLLQSMVYLNSDSSRYSKQREVLRASQIRINKLISLDDLGFDFIPADSNIVINMNLVYDSLYAQTEKFNTSLLIARKNTVISEYDYKIITSRTYPYLNLTSGYSYRYDKFETGNNTQQTDGFNYGLTLGVNIFDGFNLNRQKANARIQIDNQEIQYKQIEQQVKADLITIFYAYENNILLLHLEQENLKTAEENLEIALERYKLGSLSGIELREVQQSLLDAEERLLQAEYQTKIAEISLNQISGAIMQYVN